MQKCLYYYIILCLIVSSIVTVQAEEPFCHAHENILTLHYGGIWQNDEYLSPLLYAGQQIGIQHEWWTPFLKEKLSDWVHVGKMHINGAITNNQRAIQNKQYALGVSGGWGMHYNFQGILNINGLNIFVGPYICADFMGRSITSYENKPYSLDIALTLQAHCGIAYTLRVKQNYRFRLRYTLTTDLIGVMFIPDYWQSYYEMNQSLKGTIELASLHNRQSISHELTLDMQLRRSTWRLGIRHEYLQYSANNLSFSREQVSLVIGTLFNHQVYRTPLRY